MKKIIHLFCLSILLLTYLLIPITSIAQTQTGIISSDVKSTEQSIEREAEIEATTQSPKVNTTGNSQFLGTEEKKDSIIKSTEAQPRAPGVRAVGDDPGITIDAPANIDSNGQVVLNVDVNASAGNMSQDGIIHITIPKSIVTGDLTSQIQLPSPFYLDNPAYIDDGNGNYVLNIKYNASDIDQSQAVDFNFKIVFNAPVFTDHTTVPENVDFNANLVIDGEPKSNDSDSSKTIPTGNGKPAFLKYTMAHSDGNGHYIMDPNNPSANQFIITVNYNAQSYNDVTITDEMPEGLSLADTYPVFSTTTGDLTPVKHLNITKVVFNPNGGFTAESVTQQFENQITSDGKTFSVHLGKLTPTDSYVISYGASVNKGYDYTNFGIEFNQAVMNNNNQPIFNSNVPLTMVDNSPSATSLIKSVDKKDLATTEAKLKYTLTLNNKEGEIKAGTVVSDPLPKNTTYLSTSEHKGFSEATYDSNTNTVSYTLLEDIPQGSSRSIQLVVDCSNPNFEIGDTIVNKAGFTANGTIIYSNDATTLISSSAVLKKVDSETNIPLAGAEFKVVNDKGDVVIEHLITNQNGEVESGLLKPGKYSFIETKAPEGYVLDTTPNNFEVVEGQTTSVQLAMKNTKQSFIVVSGIKTWDDNNNQDGVRPNSITVNLLANGQVIDTKAVTAEDEWKYSFTNLPKYENGKEIIYTVTENAVTGYTTTIDGTNITNSHTPGKTSVTVTKAWDDNNNQDGLRPDSIQVQLYANGKDQADPVTLTVGSDWTYTWSGLDQKAEGKDIVYTVKEVGVVPGYNVSVDNNNQGNIVITNKHTLALTQVEGTKTWDDNNNQDGVRPNSIVVNLLANGQVIDTKSVTAEDEWKYSFTNLPKYENGKEIVYTITEDSVPSYTTEIKNFDIINHYTPEQTSATVTKHWDDSNDQEGLRPDSIQVQLYANGEKMGVPINLSKDSDWTYTWKGLSKKIKGKDVLYTVKEITKVSGYETTIDDSNKGNIIITNKYSAIPKQDNNEISSKKDTHNVEPSSTHGVLPETGENERMTLMGIETGLILLMVTLIVSVFRFKRFKNNK